MNNLIPILRFPLIREVCKIPNFYSKSITNNQLPILLKLNKLYTSNSQCYVNFNNIIVRGMAGHSKWQNIKNTKLSKDGERAKVISRFAEVIKRAIRDGGGNINPKLNSKLASAIQQAKENNVPAATIDAVLKRAENKKLKPGTGEIIGPGGSFFILDLESEQLSLSVHHMKQACRKVPGSRLAESGRSKLLFEQKGVVRVKERNDGSKVDPEKVLDDAILAGAEEVNEDKDEDEAIIFEFVTGIDDMHKVKKELETMNYAIFEFGLEYFPRQKVKLSEEDLNSVLKLYGLFEEMEDVQKIYDNVDYNSS